MDYLVHAYLQMGREREASQVVAQVAAMASLNLAEFKVGYAATAMPVRYLVERGKWMDATRFSCQ